MVIEYGIKKKEINGVLFDFDGVLADTIGDLCKTWQKAFSDFGLGIKFEDYPLLEGMKLVEIARIIGRKYGKELSDEQCLEIKRLKDRYYLEETAGRIKFYPNVEKLVDLLKSTGKRLAIVSASSREKIERTVPQDFLNKFDVIVAGEETSQGKPKPDPYLVGLKKLNLPPEECIVIENSPLGVKSAKSAGIYCIALTTTLSEDYLKEADKILSNHEELTNFLIQG